ncbi:glycosyltransferase family 4 protein [Pseudovibrio sp. SPO723]|uniref:glycosyltransferase family 4 protein n=1 Tax=Nesiotobacter zosterae TaxID=392721 RepID=UPI0029C35C58|nr:glycosyltransferase family 4 protein [Pseudovibrio sp. SPO723]MDX5592441.1 glycosyltransferase family 4 protein [Pseudovibrio sp. SPO723]
MNFSSTGATSIDLCAHDLGVFSRFRQSTCFFGCEVTSPFSGVEFRAVGAGHQVDRFHLNTALREFRPNIIVVHQHLRTAAKTARDLRDTKLLLFRHGRTREDSSLRRFLNQRDYNVLAGTVWVSQTARAHFLKQYPQCKASSWVIHNGIDCDLWRPARKQRRVLFVGRARQDKGVFDALRAFERANLQDWEMEFVLAVTNYEERQTFNRLKELAAEMEAATPTFHVNLSAEQVRAKTASATISLVPSIVQEGFGRTAIEALACGNALVATRSGGLVEAAGDAALFVLPQAPEDLARALNELVADPDRMRKLGEDGRQHVMQNFDIRAVAQKFDGLLEQVVAGETATEPAL